MGVPWIYGLLYYTELVLMFRQVMWQVWASVTTNLYHVGNSSLDWQLTTGDWLLLPKKLKWCSYPSSRLYDRCDWIYKIYFTGLIFSCLALSFLFLGEPLNRVIILTVTRPRSVAGIKNVDCKDRQVIRQGPLCLLFIQLISHFWLCVSQRKLIQMQSLFEQHKSASHHVICW